jgi:hypothetical protein
VGTAVEDDTAVWTEEVCQAGRLPTRLGGQSRCSRHVLVAEPAFERRSKVLSPTLGLYDPRSEMERRLVADVLTMPAVELGEPLALIVETKADDRALHTVSVRGGSDRRPAV